MRRAGDSCLTSHRWIAPGSPYGAASIPYSGMSATTTSTLLDIDGLADLLGVSERFVRRLVEERRIPFLKIGKHVRFDRAEVESWIKSSRVEPARPFDVVGARRPARRGRSC